jgi:hypothetical protein
LANVRVQGDNDHRLRSKEATPSDAKRPSVPAKQRDVLTDEDKSGDEVLVEEIEGELERDVACRHLLR